MTSSSIVLLSGEGTTLPAAEAKSLFSTYDPRSTFSSPDPRLLIARSGADPFRVGERIAFARRVGACVDSPADALPWLAGRRVRFRCIDLRGDRPAPNPNDYLRGAEAQVDLVDPEYELTLFRGTQDHLAITAPKRMNQGWSTRRPRKRPYFHPSAIFPKLSRALVNLSRCKEGCIFVEPFAGTGSIAIEAHVVGANVLAMDIAAIMAKGAWTNMRHFGQEWLGVVRGDAALIPVRAADAVATDIPYGRASSTRRRKPASILEEVLNSLGPVMRPGSRTVLMHPQSLPIAGSAEFAVEEEHHLHVHKLLTRTISVLVRK